MGRELRKVPSDWEHPTENGAYIPLKDGYKEDIAELVDRIATNGIEDAIDYFGGGPCSWDYMLHDVSDEERTHYMMYENTTEGTPISPAFAEVEELCLWLTATRASAFGYEPASYEWWMDVCKGQGGIGMLYEVTTKEFTLF